jgi:homoserine O-acetyltransferase
MVDTLFRKGKTLDVSRYYVILPDGIGLGGSSKPSDGLRARFPHYGYIDQVKAQHQLLEALHVQHLRLVSGISQGGMQTWLWGESYPDMMDGLAPIASMPMQVSGRNLLWRLIVMTAIEQDPSWRGGDYPAADPPTQWMNTAAPMSAIMTGNAQRLQDGAPNRAATLAFFKQAVAKLQSGNAIDTYYDLDSVRDYDPTPGVSLIKAPLLAINFTDDQVNPAELTVVRNTVASMGPKATMRMITPPTPGFGHLDILQPDLWASELGEFVLRLPSGGTN